MEERRNQHMSDVRRRIQSNGIYSHIQENPTHKINWEEVSILGKEQNWIKWSCVRWACGQWESQEKKTSPLAGSRNRTLSLWKLGPVHNRRSRKYKMCASLIVFRSRTILPTSRTLCSCVCVCVRSCVRVYSHVWRHVVMCVVPVFRS